MRSDGERQWMSHNVEWKPKQRFMFYSRGHEHMKQMSVKKLEKEFKRVNVTFQPRNENHFEKDLFEIW
jgi:hypothetical protein